MDTVINRDLVGRSHSGMRPRNLPPLEEAYHHRLSQVALLQDAYDQFEIDEPFFDMHQPDKYYLPDGDINLGEYHNQQER